MIFHPQNTVDTEGCFTFFGKANATAHPCLNKDIIKEFWQGFTFQSSALSISESDEYIFSIGKACFFLVTSRNIYRHTSYSH